MRIDRKKLLSKMIDTELNVQGLAASSNVSRVTISNIKCGKSCSEQTVAKIAQALGCAIDDLIDKGVAAPGK